MDPTTVSIALCTYNGRLFLPEQLDSIIDQTHQQLEIIIIDDCSTDGTWQIIEEYAAKDSRIKYYKNETNLGFNKNFERAISLCTGYFIAISDQDDIWEPFKVERLLANIGNNWLIFSNSALIYHNGAVKQGKLLYKFKYGKRNYRSILLQNFVTGHTCLMTREFVQRIIPFPANGYYDWWIGFIALYHNKLVYLKEMLTKYRVHENSVTQIEFNDEERQRIHFNHSITMLDSFLQYKNLQADGSKFIKKVRDAYIKKQERSGGFNFALMHIVGKYYRELFPNMKERTFLSKYNYARKFARRFT
ncbi:glycosyltransferase [Inquilinus sp. KBS0705]|nr:glycosyltransferase [Inquilinus sp. KBS0705]